MSMAAEDIRHLIISLFTAPTARDTQTTIGASNLCNQCDYCLAANLAGDMREQPLLDRHWGGRVIGTAIHGHLEKRMAEALGAASGEARILTSVALAEIGRRFPDAQIEQHRKLGTIPGYGEVGTTPDLVLPSERTVLDYKGTDKKKLATLRDFIEISEGLEPLFFKQQKRGNWVYKIDSDTTIAVSDNKHTEMMTKMAYKFTAYYGQASLYGWCLNRAGIPIDMAGIVFITRDGTMHYDNPSFAGYDDETRARGIYVLPFGYDESYAEALWNRGLQIWEALQNGATPADFQRHELCYPCGLDARNSDAPSPEALEAPIFLPDGSQLSAAA